MAEYFSDCNYVGNVIFKLYTFYFIASFRLCVSPRVYCDLKIPGFVSSKEEKVVFTFYLTYFS